MLLVLAVIISLVGCSPSTNKSDSTPNPDDTDYGDTNVSVPKGDPAFPAFPGKCWIVDTVGLTNNDTRREVDSICQRLQDDGIAEMLFVIINGVKNDPSTWSTHYGRWVKAGRKGRASEGNQNGIVWLLRPDQDQKIWISVGRGLPKFTAVDRRDIMMAAKDYFNFGNFDQGTLTLAKETDRILRQHIRKKVDSK